MKPPINPEIGRRLRVRREHLGYTQQQIADRMKTDPAWVSRCESGSNLTVRTLERFCKELRLDPADLIRKEQ